MGSGSVQRRHRVTKEHPLSSLPVDHCELAKQTRKWDYSRGSLPFPKQHRSCSGSHHHHGSYRQSWSRPHSSGVTQAKASYKTFTQAQRLSSTLNSHLNMSEEMLCQILTLTSMMSQLVPVWFSLLRGWIPQIDYRYSQAKVESVKTHLKVFAKHCNDYMTHHGHWKICKQVQVQSVLFHMLIPTAQMQKSPLVHPWLSLWWTSLSQSLPAKKIWKGQGCVGNTVIRSLATMLNKVECQAVMCTAGFKQRHAVSKGGNLSGGFPHTLLATLAEALGWTLYTDEWWCQTELIGLLKKGAIVPAHLNQGKTGY